MKIRPQPATESIAGWLYFYLQCAMMKGGKVPGDKMMASGVLPAAPSQPRVRVLIVDDMPQVLSDLRQLLDLTGLVEVIGEASNGAEAVHLAGEMEPEVVLMDLEMPGMDGYEATRQIKSKALAQRVIILSVHGGAEERQRAREAGADGFVTKGARYQVLLNAILGRNGLLNSGGANHGIRS